MTEAPTEIFKQCFTCRQETLHARVPGVGRLLYACTVGCGAPAREVSEPERSTPGAKRRAEAEANALRAKSSRDRDVEPEKEPPTRKWARRTNPVPQPKQAAPAANPLLEAIDRRVDARLAAFKAALGPAIAAEFAKLLGAGAAVEAAAAAPSGAKSLVELPEGFVCPRAPHRGPHRRKCLKAAGGDA